MENTITNALQVFKNEELNANIRVVEIDGEFWFIATDVCKALDIQNTTQALKQHLDEDERSIFKIGRQGETNIVNEPGLYNLILGSRKPEAKQFKRWITHDVLPSIRKTGKYELPKETENGRQLIARALIEAHKIIAEMDNKIVILQPKAIAYDAIINKFDSVSWRDFCNKIRDTFNVKENEVRQKLLDERWIYKINTLSGKTKYKPYKETIDRDLMIVKDVLCKDGEVRPGNFFTYKGQQKLIDWVAPVVVAD